MAHPGASRCFHSGHTQGVCRAVTSARVRDTSSHRPPMLGLGHYDVEHTTSTWTGLVPSGVGNYQSCFTFSSWGNAWNSPFLLNRTSVLSEFWTLDLVNELL